MQPNDPFILPARRIMRTLRTDMLRIISREEARVSMPYAQLLFLANDEDETEGGSTPGLADVPACLLPVEVRDTLLRTAGDVSAYPHPRYEVVEGIGITYEEWTLWLDGHRYVLCGIVDGVPVVYEI